MEERYVVALGSNRRHHRHGLPPKVIAAALRTLEGHPTALESASPIITTPPLGHTRRRYANAAALVRTALMPDELLEYLKRIERNFGRRSRGRRWGDRVLDLDILLWNGGPWVSPDLVIPHIHFRHRSFALGPAARIAPRWRDPLTGLTLRQLDARLTRPRLTRGRLTLGGRLPIGHTRWGP